LGRKARKLLRERDKKRLEQQETHTNISALEVGASTSTHSGGGGHREDSSSNVAAAGLTKNRKVPGCRDSPLTSCYSKATICEKRKPSPLKAQDGT